MPERPKRRKNNKNKRKNKHVKPDASKNNSDVNNVNLNNGEICNEDSEKNQLNPEESNIALKDIISTQDEVTKMSKDTYTKADITPNRSECSIEDMNSNSNSLIKEVVPNIASENVKNLVEGTHSVSYIVESPDQSLNKTKTKLKSVKSKSLDNEDATNIVEITEDALLNEGDNALELIDSQNIIISQVESDIEWEKTDELIDNNEPQSEKIATGTLSVTTLPLAVAQCDQNKSLTPEEEKSLRSYLKTLNLVTQPENINAIEIKTEIEQIINQEIKQRLRKKGLADDFCLHRLGPPRILDVIDEEGSSESSMTSRRQSYLSDKKSDIEDLEDDVFEDNKCKIIKRKSVACSTSGRKVNTGHLVHQECVLVGAKITEPEITEARGEWTMKTVEKMTGAEVVYLTDTSSSSSSLHEIGDDDDDDDDDGVDTDVSIRMMTPTIEVTDTENFLKRTFVSVSQDDKEKKSVESSQINTDYKTDDEKKQQLNKNNVGHEINYEIDPKLFETDEIENIRNKAENNSVDKNQSTSTNEHIEKIINIEIEKDPKEMEADVKSNPVQNLHEIVVLSTDNIKTNLYVKDIDEIKHVQQNTQELKDDKEVNQQVEIQIKQNDYDIEAKILKCEFNDAINNLIKEVTSDSEAVDENPKDTFTRQDSSSSVDSSQCTAKYNPNYESLNDISNILHDEISNKIKVEHISSATSHVKDVFECVTGTTTQNKGQLYTGNTEQPLRLKDLCVRNIASLPYGDKILEELASVSKRLQNFTAEGKPIQTTFKNQDQANDMPRYRLPDVSTIESISLPTKVKDPTPPPIQPRHSSLKKSNNDEQWTAIPTKSEPVYVCLSPSQKMLMDKTNTVITKEDASHLVDMHSKFVDRRGYNEEYKNDKEREENEFYNPPIVPFKSQTGSRLLALIRDPSLTRNINSLNDRLNYSLDELQLKRKALTPLTKNNNNELNFTQNFSFKPIPPPRPKKYSTSFYESDECSDFTENTMRSMKSERKHFHYSTGNLNKEIEDDVSSIQNMHRYLIDTKTKLHSHKNSPRRPSLPKDLCEQQMEYIRKKEKEVEAELQRLEALKNTVSPVLRKGPRAPVFSEKEIIRENIKDGNNYVISHKKDFGMSSQSHDTHDIKKGKMSSLFSSSQEELLREKMYSEYVTQMAEREERKQHKVIKITTSPSVVVNSKISKSMSALNAFDSRVNNRIEKEFISKARERWDKLGIKDPETEDEREYTHELYKEPKVIEHKIKVIEGGKEKDVKKLPNHLQEFVQFTAKDQEQCAGSSGESKAGPATPHLVILCAVIIIVIAAGKYLLRLLRYN